MNLTPAKLIGIVLASIHLVLFVLFSFEMNFGSQDAMSGMLWGIWRTLDFPVSLAAFYGFVPVPIEWNVATTIEFIYPYLIHGIVGTVWWFFVPVLAGVLFNRVLHTNKPQA